MHVFYPGSFDPPTHGHLSLIARSSSLFEKVTVCVAVNPEKKSWLSGPERKKLLLELCKTYKNVEVISDDGLVVDCANRVGAQVIIKGLRGMSDLEHEHLMADANRSMGGGMETLFLISEQKTLGIRSSLVRQIHQLKGDLSPFVPKVVIDYLEAKP